MAAVLAPAERDFLWVLAGRIVPESASLDEAARGRFFVLIEEALAARPAAMRSQFRLFLKVLRLACLPFSGAGLDKMLRRFENAPVRLLRQGLWGVKAMVYLGYYGRPEAGESIGYRPTKRGNEVLRERARI